MAEAKKKVEEQRADLGLEGFDKFFDGDTTKTADATTSGDSMQGSLEKLISKLGDLVTLSVDQRVETAKLANQLIENQRQLVATQQILIRLMERSIDLTRHVTALEEKLPAVFELPIMVENLRVRIAQLENVEID
jgi:hypothetical protein